MSSARFILPLFLITSLGYGADACSLNNSCLKNNDSHMTELSPEYMVVKLKQTYTYYNQTRFGCSNMIQDTFLSQVRGEKNSPLFALNFLRTSIYIALIKLQPLAAYINDIEFALDDAVIPQNLNVPKFTTYTIETIIPPNFHRAMLFYYFRRMEREVLEADSALFTEIELILGTKYACCLSDFREISMEEEILAEDEKFFSSSVMQTINSSLASQAKFILKLKHCFLKNYDLDYTDMLTLYRNKKRG